MNHEITDAFVRAIVALHPPVEDYAAWSWNRLDETGHFRRSVAVPVEPPTPKAAAPRRGLRLVWSRSE